MKQVTRFLLLLCILLTGTSFTPLPSEKEKLNKDFLAGRNYYQKQNYDKARFHLLRAVRENPDDQAALYILVNIEERTGHYATAIVHANQVLSLNPYNEHMWQKKIGLYRLQGNDVEADRLLERICTIYPENTTLQARLQSRREEQALAKYKEQRLSGDVNGQIESLQYMINTGKKNKTASKQELGGYYASLCNLLLQQGRTGEALDVAEMGIIEQPGNMLLIRKKVGMLTDQGRTMEAYAFLKQISHSNSSGEIVNMLRELEETLVLQAQLSDPYTMNGRRWENAKTHNNITAEAKESLNYLVSTSISRGYLDDAREYVADARKVFGDTPTLIYKAYMVEQRSGNSGRALQILRQLHEVSPSDQEVIDLLAIDGLRNASEYIVDLRYHDAAVLLDSIIKMNPDAELLLSAEHKLKICQNYFEEKHQKEQLERWELLASRLLNEHRSEELILVCDSALAVDSTLEMMVYYKGLAHERLHHWNEAYACFKKYKPSPMELAEHRRHLASILYHTYYNTLNVEYQQARLGQEDKLTANATVSYTRKIKKNGDEFAASVTYSARDYSKEEINGYYDEHDNWVVPPTNPSVTDHGGVGLQLQASYKHNFTEKIAGEVGAAVSNRYFPVVTLKAAADIQLPKEWTFTPRVSYRRTDAYHRTDDKLLAGRHTNIISLGGMVGKPYRQFHLSGAADAFLVGQRSLCFNASAKMQYFPLENSRTHVFASIGAGTAPEMEIIDNSLPTGFKHLNSFVSGGGYYAITTHLGGALHGTWFNLVDSNGNHRNYFYINAQLQITF